MIIIYVNQAYLIETEKNLLLLIGLALGILYPALYDWSQMFKVGLVAYFTDPSNYADMLYIWGSILNIVLQSLFGPFILPCKILMCFIVLLLIMKTFFFLRIFPTLTPIVVMITNVIYDLRIFLLFYIILIFLFCQLYAVLGLGNGYPDENAEPVLDDEGEPIEDDPTEYDAIGLHAGEFLWTLRLSMGDFSAIGASTELDKAENVIFWLIWVMTVVITCIIFLNFIVAEASASYSHVVETLESVIQKEKAALINESEEMTLNSSKTQ
jgi:hypothetical protein